MSNSLILCSCDFVGWFQTGENTPKPKGCLLQSTLQICNCCSLILKMLGLTSHTIPWSEPFLTSSFHRGHTGAGCLQPNVSTETVGEQCFSSRSPQISNNKWFLPSHTSSCDWQSRCNYSGGGKRKQMSECLKRKKNKTDCGELFVLSAWWHLHSLGPLCLLTLVSTELGRLNGWSLTYGLSRRWILISRSEQDGLLQPDFYMITDRNFFILFIFLQIFFPPKVFE